MNQQNKAPQTAPDAQTPAADAPQAPAADPQSARQAPTPPEFAYDAPGGPNDYMAGAQNPFYAQQPSPYANPYYATGVQAQNPYIAGSGAPQPAQQGGLMDSLTGTTTEGKLVRGLLVGAAAAYLLTNEKAQKTLIKTGMKLYGAVAGGVEEFKEKIMDAKAELEEEAMQSDAPQKAE